jgi:hypothetical protein
MRHFAVLGGWFLITLLCWLSGANAAIQLIGFILWAYAFNAWRLKTWRLW